MFRYKIQRKLKKTVLITLESIKIMAKYKRVKPIAQGQFVVCLICTVMPLKFK